MSALDRLAGELVARVGEPEAVRRCVALLRGDPREEHLDVLPYLTGFGFELGSAQLDPASWKDYWVRTWGARGLLRVWRDDATPAVVAGLDDEHWRPAEMCLKVASLREIGEAGPAAARLTMAELPRVRTQAARTLGLVGDTEHADAVAALLEDRDGGVRAAAAAALERMARRLDLPR